MKSSQALTSMNAGIAALTATRASKDPKSRIKFYARRPRDLEGFESEFICHDKTFTHYFQQKKNTHTHTKGAIRTLLSISVSLDRAL
jgi:hypothetical protein